MRVLSENSEPYETAVLENGEAKYKETTFIAWWTDATSDDTKKTWTDEEGNTIDPVYGELDPETGEPLEDEEIVEETEA